MSRRLFRTPEPVAELVRGGARGGPHLVRGEVLAALPATGRAIVLPYGLDAGSGAEPVLARVDVEELYAFGRPGLETLEHARDLFFTDGTAGAILRMAGDAGHLHPEVELHLGARFVERALDPPLGALSRTAFVRTLRVGDPIYVYGRARVEQDTTGLLSGTPGYREAALMAAFDADAAPLEIFDETAFARLAAWHRLPWYRKLSAIARGR